MESMNGKNGWVIGLVMVLAPWIYGQSSLVLDLNGLSELQKVEAYVGQADRLDAQSEILFLVYATQRASEILRCWQRVILSILTSVR